MVFHKVFVIVIFTALFKNGQSFYEGNNAISQTPLQASKASHVSPYTVAIIRDKDWQKRCVGTLISDSFVLTAAQCVDCEFAELIIGAYDILVSEKTQVRQPIDRSHIIFHPLYDYRNLDNDIALVRLPQKVTLTPFVNVVTLPDSDFHVEYGTNAYITGWEHSLNGYSNILSQAELTIISHDKCISFWPMARINFSKMCATYSHRHSQLQELRGTECIVDPGSPLTLHGHPDKLIGILTGESTCGSALPEIFVNVAQYKDWIDAELERELEIVEVISSTSFTGLELPEVKPLDDPLKVGNDKLILNPVEDVVKEISAKGVNIAVETEQEVVQVNPEQGKIKPSAKLEVVKPNNLYQLEEIIPQRLKVEPLDYPFLELWDEIPSLLETISQPVDAALFDYLSLVQLDTPLINLVDIVPQTIYNYPVFEDLIQVPSLYNLRADIISPSLETILIGSPSSYNLIGEIIPQPLEAIILEEVAETSALISIGELIPQLLETTLFNYPLLGDSNPALLPYSSLGDITYKPMEAALLGYPYNLLRDVMLQSVEGAITAPGEVAELSPLFTVGDAISEHIETSLFDIPLLGDWELALSPYTLLGGIASQSIDASLLGYPYNLVGEAIPQPFDTTLFDYPVLGDWDLALPPYTLLEDITSQPIDASLLGYPYNLVGEAIPQPFDTTLFDYPYSLLGDITSQPIDAGLFPVSPLYSAGGLIQQPLESPVSDFSPFGNWIEEILPRPLDDALFDYLSLGDTSFISAEDVHQGVPIFGHPPFEGWEGVAQQYSTIVNEIKPPHRINVGEIIPQLEEVTIQHTESDSIHLGESIPQPEDGPQLSDESVILYPTGPFISDVYFEPVESDVTGLDIPDENFGALPEIILKEDSKNKEEETKVVVINLPDGVKEGVKVISEDKPSYGLKEGLELPDIIIEENLKNKDDANLIVEILESGLEDGVKVVVDEKPNHHLTEGVNIVNDLEGVLDAVVESKPGYGFKEELEVVSHDVTPDIILGENLKNKERETVVEILEGGLEKEVKIVLEEKPNYVLAEEVDILDNLEGALEAVAEDYGLKEGFGVVVENKPSYGLKEEQNEVSDVTLNAIPEKHLKKIDNGKVIIEMNLADLDLGPDWYKDGKLTFDELPFKVNQNAVISTNIDPTQLIEE